MTFEVYESKNRSRIVGWINSHATLCGKQPPNCNSVNEVWLRNKNGCRIESYEYTYNVEKMASKDTADFFLEILKSLFTFYEKGNSTLFQVSKELNSNVNVLFGEGNRFKIVATL